MATGRRRWRRARQTNTRMDDKHSNAHCAHAAVAAVAGGGVAGTAAAAARGMVAAMRGGRCDRRGSGDDSGVDGRARLRFGRRRWRRRRVRCRGGGGDGHAAVWGQRTDARTDGSIRTRRRAHKRNRAHAHTHTHTQPPAHAKDNGSSTEECTERLMAKKPTAP